MKVLLINTVPTDKNGITNVLFNYLKAMNTVGMQIDIVSINKPDDYYTNEIKKKKGYIYVLPRLNGIISYLKSLYRLIKKNKYKIFHIHGNSHTTVLELATAMIAGCTTRIVHAHNTTCKSVMIHNLLTPLFNLLCTNRLACGKAAGNFMFGGKQFTVVNNGVDTERFAFNQEHRDFIRKKHNLQGCKVIGHVGYFLEVKNHQWIIEVFKELIKYDSTYRLVLIGEGELKNLIVNKAKKLGLLDYITFTGNIDNVDEYICAIDLILMPSLYEGLPLTLIEQQANGLRCILSDTITTEADKTGNLTFISLSSPATKWAQTIIDIKMITDLERKELSNKAIRAITECGYSIKREAEKLRNYYLQSIR